MKISSSNILTTYCDSVPEKIYYNYDSERETITKTICFSENVDGLTFILRLFLTILYINGKRFNLMVNFPSHIKYRWRTGPKTLGINF